MKLIIKLCSLLLVIGCSMNHVYALTRLDKTYQVFFDEDYYVYNTQKIIPDIYIEDEDGDILERENYKISLSNHKNAGKAKLTIKGKGSYEGTITKYFTIRKLPVKQTVSVLNKCTYIYDGKLLKPTVKLKINHKVISKENYAVTYINNRLPGRATVKIIGRNNLSGVYNRYYLILPPKLKIDTLSYQNHNLIIKQNTNVEMTGIEVNIDGNKVLKKNKKEILINNIKEGKHVVKIRGYIKVQGVYYYGPYSPSLSFQ